jgi:hypothetical protein
MLRIASEKKILNNVAKYSDASVLYVSFFRNGE